MKVIKAVVMDVYGTLLEVSAGPQRADEMWQAFWQRRGSEVPLLWEDLPGVMSAMVSASHRQSRLRGEEYPEVLWHEMLAQVCGVPDWSTEEKRGLCFFEAKLSRRCCLMRGAAAFLLQCQSLGVGTAICSNAQSCTEQELLEAMLAERVDVDDVFPPIRFWSYEHGFAKPSMKPFAWLEQHLANYQVLPEEILMIGDNPVKDIAPAEARGWQTHLLENGNWPRLNGVQRLEMPIK